MNTAVEIKKTKAEQEYTDLFKAAADSLPGDEAVKQLRTEAFTRFEQQGLPNRRVEEWKYSDVKGAIKDAYALAATAELSDADIKSALGSFADLDCYRIIFVNGRMVNDSATYGDGVDVQSLSAMFTENAAWVADHLGKPYEFPENDTPVALNTAFMADGITIRVSKELDKPLHIAFINTGTTNQAVTVRNLVDIAEGAKATIIEQYATLSETAFQTNVVTESKIGKEADLTHIKVQSENADTTHLSTWSASIAEKAKYSPFQLVTGAGFSRDQLYARFDGEHAAINYGSVYLGKGKQHGDSTLVVDHAVPHCESRELYKGVMANESRGVFQGKLMVKPIAQKTDGKQMAQALLLSETAEFDAKPELEIFADDVVCGHGATSGQIDEDLLFYLRARGIPKDEAMSLLIQAFTGEALELIEDEAINECLTDIVVAWLKTIKGAA